jgi:TatD DNase family protein
MSLLSLVDTHCHLTADKLVGDVPNLLSRAQAAGVGAMVNIGCCPASSALVVEQLSLSPSLYAAVGIQPHDASLFTLEEGEKIKQLALSQPGRVVAIGEIGLDAHYTLSPMDKQIVCFEYFLDLALELNLPVVIHVRETHEAVKERLQKRPGLRGVIHCFTGSAKEALEFLECGFFISFSGIVTFKNAKELQETAKRIPRDRILIETDSPYLSPMPLRGKCNEPSHLVHTHAFLATLRGEDPSEFARITTENAKTLFGLDL